MGPVCPWGWEEGASECTGNYTFIPYMITPHNKVYCCDSSFMKGLTELMQPNFELLLGPICLPLVDRFIQLLKVAQACFTRLGAKGMFE